MTKQTDITYAIPPQPRQLRLDTTTFCQARCLSCHRYLSKRDGNMSLGMITDILDDVARWNPPLTEIVPTNYGEFFSIPDWRRILGMIAQKLPQTQIVIPTNGGYLDADAVQQLAEVPTVRIINFSVNAFFEDTYEQFMGLPASNLKQIEQAVKMMKALRPDMFFSISMVNDVAYQTDLERDYFIDYWQKFLKDIKAENFNVQIIPAASAGRPGQKPAKPVKTPCRSIFADMVIGYDGKLSLCCFDSGMKLDLGEYSGDAKKDWTNEKITELRRLHNGHKREEIPLCEACTFA